MSATYFNACVDDRGVPVEEFDVLKVFHFIGARRKKHYMYKQVRVVEVKEGPRKGLHLYGNHLCGPYDPSNPLHNAYYLSSDNGVLRGVEIVQSPNWETLNRHRPAKPDKET